MSTPGEFERTGDRTIVVTGAASGIGAACAKRLSRKARVIGVDVAPSDIVADLSTPEGRRSAAGEVAHVCPGGLEGVVTCAGLAGAADRPGSLLVSVNYFGTVELLELLQPLLAKGARPAVVAVSSHATTIQPGLNEAITDACLNHNESLARELSDQAGSMATYPASKLAVARWVRRQAPSAAWAGATIRLNAIAPGMVETPLVAEGRADPEVAPLLDMVPIPIGETGRPEDIAALVELMVGPEGRYFCGSVVFVDGGTDALLRPDEWPARWDLDVGAALRSFRGEGGSSGTTST